MIADLRDKLLSLEHITEAKGHLDHPEDLVFLDGSAGASRAVDATVKTAKNPKSVTIKWDGYPALIFGRGPNNKFSIMDKHMFNKRDLSGRQVYSPEQFVQYDQARGVDRSGLHQLIANIWPDLEKADRGKGYYWGDVLFFSPLQEKNGLYTFRANPNGITYTVETNSEMGRFLKGKQAGIVVHQYLEPNAASTDEATPLNGTIGSLKNNTNVAIVPAKMPFTPKLKIDNRLVNTAKSEISKYGSIVDEFLNNAPQARNAFIQLFTTYINKKIVEGSLSNLVNGFYEYFKTRPMTDQMRNKLAMHFENNSKAIIGAFSIWIALYNLKMSLVDQLNKAAETSPVKGYLQNGQQTQEGFVSQGLKFVDRMGFSRQNLARR